MNSRWKPKQKNVKMKFSEETEYIHKMMVWRWPKKRTKRKNIMETSLAFSVLEPNKLQSMFEFEYFIAICMQREETQCSEQCNAYIWNVVMNWKSNGRKGKKSLSKETNKVAALRRKKQ